MASTHQNETYKQYFKKVGSLSKLALERKAQSGDFPGCAPVGYKNSYDNSWKKVIIIDPEKAPLVQIAFRLVGESNLPLREVLRTVTKLGLRSRNDKPLGPSALWGILTNPFYTGYIRFHNQVLLGNHEALVDQGLFENVQANLVNRKNHRI